MVITTRSTRRRGPIEVGGQDGAIFGNQVNAWDGAVNVNQYGMNHNTRKPYDEILTVDKVFNVWDDLGKPIYFEVNFRADEFCRVTLLGDKHWADQTDLERIEAGIVCCPGETLYIHDEEFKNLLVEIPDCSSCSVHVSIFASGFIPDNRGVNQYRGKIDMNVNK